MTVGVDVSQATLVWCALDGQPATLPNEAAAITAWLATLPHETTIAMEATGRYHRTLADLAVAQGYRVLVLNPRDVHHYAQSLTPRATTDPIMARVIAEFVTRETRHPLQVYVPAPAFVDDVRTLVRIRSGMVQEKIRLHHQRREAPDLAEILDPLVRDIRTRITQMTKRIADRVRTQPELGYVRSVPGFGELTSAYLVMLLASHAFATSDAFVAFLGWDLRIKDSGKERKRHCLTKRGDPEARRLLFLAARTVAKTPSPFQHIYQRALEARYSKTEAAVIVARKLARVAWSVYTHQVPYEATRVLTQR
jgi:transposase